MRVQLWAWDFGGAGLGRGLPDWDSKEEGWIT